MFTKCQFQGAFGLIIIDATHGKDTQNNNRDMFLTLLLHFQFSKKMHAVQSMKLTNVMQTLICKPPCKQKLESKLICANTKEANVPTHSDNSCMKSSGHGGCEETKDETD